MSWFKSATRNRSDILLLLSHRIHMYVTAHRVAKGNLPETGINAFLYLHGSAPLDVKASWTDADVDKIVFEKTGTLASKYESVEPGGNRVMSYLDVVAPDKTSAAQIETALNQFKTEIGTDQSPMTRIFGTVAIRFGLCYGLAGQENLEFDALKKNIVRITTTEEEE